MCSLDRSLDRTLRRYPKFTLDCLLTKQETVTMPLIWVQRAIKGQLRWIKHCTESDTLYLSISLTPNLQYFDLKYQPFFLHNNFE